MTLVFVKYLFYSAHGMPVAIFAKFRDDVITSLVANTIWKKNLLNFSSWFLDESPVVLWKKMYPYLGRLFLNKSTDCRLNDNNNSENNFLKVSFSILLLYFWFNFSRWKIGILKKLLDNLVSFGSGSRELKRLGSGSRELKSFGSGS